MKNVFTAKWFYAAAVRALRTFAQTMLGVVGACAVVSEVNWGTALSASALAAFASLLTSITGLPEVDNTPEV